MANDLVTPGDLSGLPGAPFDDAVVDLAVASLRAAVGWHIAPSRTETLTVDGEGGGYVMLPSLNVTDVTAVRDIYTPATPHTMTGFRWSKAGVLTVPGYVPYGYASLEVDLVHGYDECPTDLYPVIVALIQGATFNATVSQQSAGPFAVTATNLSTLGSWLDRVSGGVLARYRIPSRP